MASLFLFFNYGNCSTTKSQSSTLEFNVQVGQDQNYFVQNTNGAFHVMATNSPQSRLIIASPAGNAGAFLNFTGTSAPSLSKSPTIAGKEQVTIELTMAEK